MLRCFCKHSAGIKSFLYGDIKITGNVLSIDVDYFCKIDTL